MAEAVVNDLRPKKEQIHAIYNGHITGRKIGDPISSIGKKRLEGELHDTLINYENEGAHGRRLKSSAIAIRNPQGKLIGSFGINVDISIWDTVAQYITQFTQIDSPQIDREIFKTTPPPKTEIKSRIQSILTEKGWGHPLERRQKRDIILHLHQEGYLYKRGAVAIIATLLQLTRPTVYRYLKPEAPL